MGRPLPGGAKLPLTTMYETRKSHEANNFTTPDYMWFFSLGMFRWTIFIFLPDLSSAFGTPSLKKKQYICIDAPVFSLMNLNNNLLFVIQFFPQSKAHTIHNHYDSLFSSMRHYNHRIQTNWFFYVQEDYMTLGENFDFSSLGHSELCWPHWKNMDSIRQVLLGLESLLCSRHRYIL